MATSKSRYTKTASVYGWVKTRHNKLDKLFSKLIRERDDWTCRASGENKRHEPASLHCAHIMGRRHVGLRWHPMNAVSLTPAKHFYFTERPFEWTYWCEEEFGKDRVTELRRVANVTVKWPKSLREDIYQHYKGELERLQKMRLEGVTGRLEVELHPEMWRFVDG